MLRMLTFVDSVSSAAWWRRAELLQVFEKVASKFNSGPR